MLTVNNFLLFLDLGVFPNTEDLRVIRLCSSLGGMLFLLYGFWESDWGKPLR